MSHCTNSFPLPGSFARLTFLIAVIALPAIGAYAQTEPAVDPFQRVSHATARPCTVAPSGEVTYLVKNNVELSVTQDWDCDGHADAYDNCVGMANATQTDSNSNGIGDTCEAVTLVKAGPLAKSKSTAKAKVTTDKTPSKSRPNTKPTGRTAKRADKRSRSDVKKRRNT